MKDHIKQFIPGPGFLTCILLLIQLCYYIMFMLKGLAGFSASLPDIFFMLFGFFSLYILGVLAESLMPVKAVARALTPVVIITAWGLYAYHLSTGSSLDFSLVRDNIGISFSSESLQMISSPFSSFDLLFIALLTAAAVFLELKFSLISVKKSAGWRGGTAALLSALVIIMLPVHRGDEFTLFIKSAFNGNDASAAVADTAGYPYDRDMVNQASARPPLTAGREGRPNIILLLIESFNANFVEAQAAGGLYYTPEFNALINRGVYIDRFYGNSIQTCKGQAAVFFSILPSINGKIFVDYPELNVAGFPSILRDAGYSTIFFQAFHDLKFDNTEHNMKKAGFSVVKSYAEFRRKADRPCIWGWGVEDAIFYERAFELLDSEHAANPGKPLFAALATVGTHIPCDGMPAGKRVIHRDPQNIREKYSNALRLSDSQLPDFFEQIRQRKYLENTVVIITSDHSFPMKEHGLYNNEICFYDEAFRVPFLLIWDGVIKPERVKGRAYSQLDIGPTIADLAGIRRGRNNMTGISVFDRRSGHPVYLIQPYNGKFVEVVNYPLKFITHIRTGKEYLFDLENDPAERVNLMDKGFDPQVVSALRGSLNAVYLNQKLIEENRILRP